MSGAPAEEEDTTVELEITFDFTEQRPEPIELLPEAGADRPPLILARNERLMPVRYRPLA
ncbi:hypothetical protein ABZ858_35245 [Streptomyces sp. NPDC047017]|uniref:hypothetical protein n=1 Tax=unclassified Streptomyces TaxID=2593676 RepID=UPI0013C8C734|nr:hypothetical protein [Streptomyces sp. SID10815]NEA46852.1 hypothetical protein [Streptomyces sp. SID10815]